MTPTPTRVGFSTGKFSPVSATIRAATGADVSHAYFVYYDPVLDDEFILEEDIGGFQIMRYSQFKVHNKVVREIIPPATPEALKDALRMADKWLGARGYDYEGLFSMQIVMVARVFKKRIKNPFHSAHSMYCSEAVTVGLQFAGCPGFSAIDPPSEDPMSLSKDMIANGGILYDPHDDEITKP